MRRFALPLLWIASALRSFCADAPVTTLALPHALRPEEAVFLELKLGSLARGLRVEVSTPSGRSLGAISPFGARAGADSGTYTIPVPPDAVSGDHLAIVIRVNDGGRKRSPAEKEIRSIAVKVSGPGSRP
jgi:hypothetical protein